MQPNELSFPFLKLTTEELVQVVWGKTLDTKKM